MSNEQPTFIMIKPDGVERGLTDEIIGRFNGIGLRMRGRRDLIPPLELAEAHYAVHKERPFYGELVQFMTSGPVVVQVLEGEDAIRSNRRVMGATNPAEAEPGTIRADFADSVQANAVHGSDGPDTARSEIAFFFDEDQICPRE